MNKIGVTSYKHTYIGTLTHIHIATFLSSTPYIRITYIFAHTYLHHTYVLHTYSHIHIATFLSHTRICVYIIRTHTYTFLPFSPLGFVHVSLRLDILNIFLYSADLSFEQAPIHFDLRFSRLYVRTCRHNHMYVCTCVCMYVCMYMYMYVCMYVVCVQPHLCCICSAFS